MRRRPLPLVAAGLYEHVTGQLPALRVWDVQLPNSALVVRGNGRSADSWTENAAATRAMLVQYPGIGGRYGCSVAAGDAAIEDLLDASSVPGGGVYRRSTVETLRDAGFAIQLTSRPRHASIWLPDIKRGTIDDLMSLFGEPEKRPEQ